MRGDPFEAELQLSQCSNSNWLVSSVGLPRIRPYNFTISRHSPQTETTTNNVRLLLLLWIFSRARHELVFYGICLPSISSVDDNTAIQRHPLNKGVVAERLGNIWLNQWECSSYAMGIFTLVTRKMSSPSSHLKLSILLNLSLSSVQVIVVQLSAETDPNSLTCDIDSNPIPIPAPSCVYSSCSLLDW